MLSPAYPLVLAALASPVPPAPDVVPTPPPPRVQSINDVARAADATVVVAPCMTSSIACFHIGENRIKISRPIYRVLTNRSCRNPTARSLAVFILTHEAGHAHGIYTESGANSYAYSTFRRTARKLGFRLWHAPAVGAIASSWMEWGGRC